MNNCNLLKFEIKKDLKGSLIAIENNSTIPFAIKRIYYIFDVQENARRGFHAHADLEQVLICLSGKVKILVKNPYEEMVFELSSPNEGLFIGDMVWREMYDFSPGAVLLVLASKSYSENDYYRSYELFEKEFLKGEKK